VSETAGNVEGLKGAWGGHAQKGNRFTPITEPPYRMKNRRHGAKQKNREQKDQKN